MYLNCVTDYSVSQGFQKVCSKKQTYTFCKFDTKMLNTLNITHISRMSRPPYLRLNHVDATRAEGLDAVVDVYNSLTLGHVQHHVQDNVAARSPSTRTAFQEKTQFDNLSSHIA